MGPKKVEKTEPKTPKVAKTPKEKAKVKVKKDKSPRVATDTQTKTKVLSADRICNRCKVHGVIQSVKGHKCPEEILACSCQKCVDYVEKTRRKKEARKKRVEQKNAVKDKTKTDSKSFVKSLKNKSKKILNSKKKSSGQKGRPSNKQVVGNGMAGDQLMPQLQPQDTDLMDLADLSHNSSSTDINPSIPADAEPDVTKSSAPLCAKYLKACEELSRKLSKYQLTQDEMIACFKYSMVRDCLGDVELAAQKIAFASQEIRLGAVYNIQHPTDELRADHSSQSSRGGHPQLCSTQYVPNSGVHYSPHFTPIHRK